MKAVIKTLGTVAEYINGRAFKPSEWEREGLPIIRIQNLNDDDAKYNYSTVQHEDKYLIHNGDLLFAWAASLGAYIWKGSEAWLNQHIYKVIPYDDVLKEYLYYYLQYVVADLYSKAHGTGMVHITKALFMATKIPVPPLNEQARIISRVEELFSEIDSGIDTLLKTKEQLYAYRQAVLKDAFSIYNKNGTIDICNITDDIRIGPFGTMLHKSDYVAGGVPVINPQHIKNNAIKPSKNVTVNEAKANELSAYRLKTNDIIMGRRGEMGRTAPVSINEAGWICGTGSILFRLKPEYDAEFYSQILSSPDVVHYLEENATGTTMKNLNEGIVAHIPVPIVTRKMQDRIKLVMDEKLSVCEDIEKTVEKTLEQAEAMRQSVLKNAFEGEL